MRLYLDTNVFGYAVDPTKETLQQVSLDVLQTIREGQHEVVVSDVLAEEIEEGSPEEVQALYQEIAELATEEVGTTQHIARLADAYITARAIGAGRREDALHIALATVGRCDALLSWDTKHIVTDWRIERYNSVNRKRKYRNLAIQTPAKFVQGRKRKK